jgi:hypothetical protein
LQCYVCGAVVIAVLHRSSNGMRTSFLYGRGRFERIEHIIFENETVLMRGGGDMATGVGVKQWSLCPIISLCHPASVSCL